MNTKNDGLLQNENLILCILRNRHQTCKSKTNFLIVRVMATLFLFCKINLIGLILVVNL